MPLPRKACTERRKVLPGVGVVLLLSSCYLSAGEPALKGCPKIIGDEIERIVVWQHGSGLVALAGQNVRLRFVLRDADLFSFRLAPAPNPQR